MRRKIIISLGIVLAATGGLAALALLLPKEDLKSDPVTFRQFVEKSEAPEGGNITLESDLSELDFNVLRSINPDIVAWIVVEGTDISYPVLRAGDDKPEDFYLHHNIHGRYSFKGSIYMQKRNSPDFSDFMTVLYGHNMNDGSMFRQLHWIRKLGFLQENNRITVYMPGGIKHYEILSAVIQSNENILDAYDDFKDEDVKEAFWNTVSSDEDIGHMLVLSTCCGDPSRRLIVTAKELASD